MSASPLLRRDFTVLPSTIGTTRALASSSSAPPDLQRQVGCIHLVGRWSSGPAPASCAAIVPLHRSYAAQRPQASPKAGEGTLSGGRASKQTVSLSDLSPLPATLSYTLYPSAQPTPLAADARPVPLGLSRDEDAFLAAASCVGGAERLGHERHGHWPEWARVG